MRTRQAIRGAVRFMTAASGVGAMLLVAGCSGRSLVDDRGRALLVEGPPEAVVVAQVQAAAVPLTGAESDYDALLDEIGDARVVLLGESTHGTHEFYQARGVISQRLIEEKGFDAIAVEANWPEALLVNQYVRGGATGDEIEGAKQALGRFEEFPRWMWRNRSVSALVEWLHAYNAALPAGAEKVGFYGIDLQTFSPAMEVVIDLLTPLNPPLAEQARVRYECLDAYREEPIGYGPAVAAGLAESCAAEVAAHVREVERWVRGEAATNGREATFSVLQSARMLARAEYYFRAVGLRDVSTWNVRDQYMADVVDRLLLHLSRPGQPAKIVVWAHNSHVGDARATDRSAIGELNLGQLLRQRWGEQVMLVGFTTYSGEVMAASGWGEKPTVMQVRPAQEGSFAAIFHATGIPRFLLLLRERPVGGVLNWPRPERAIGVIYQPEFELFGHYFEARLGTQFDAVIHFDETSAVTPLDALTVDGGAP